MEKPNYQTLLASFDDIKMPEPEKPSWDLDLLGSFEDVKVPSPERPKFLLKIRSPITSEDGKIIKFPIYTETENLTCHRYSEFEFLRTKLI